MNPQRHCDGKRHMHELQTATWDCHVRSLVPWTWRALSSRHSCTEHTAVKASAPRSSRLALRCALQLGPFKSGSGTQ